VVTGAQAHLQGNRLGMSPVAVARPQAATLYLALFLALLAFFLFLTSISSFDPARAVPVIDSVEAQFAEAMDAQAGPERSVPHFAGPAGQRIVADAGFTDSVTQAFAALTDERDVAAHVDGVAWHAVRLGPEAIFVRETAALSAQGRQAIEAAAAAMATDSGSTRTTHRLDIAVGGPQDLALRHLDYSVKKEHYAAVSASLLWTLEELLGSDFSKEVENAWSETFAVIETVMTDAAYPSEPPAA